MNWRHSLRLLRASLFHLLLPLAVLGLPVPQLAGLPLGDEADPYAAAVARLARAVVQYSRWPGEPRALRACVVGPTDHADDLLAGKEIASVGVTASRRSVEAVQAAECDIFYIGRLGIEEQRLVTDRMRGEAVLTIAENDPACRSRAMFCLLFEADALSFRLNIDAVANSQMRVDPRVLRLGAGEAP